MYSEESGEDEEDEDDDEEGYEVEADFTEEPGNDSGCTAGKPDDAPCAGLRERSCACDVIGLGGGRAPLAVPAPPGTLAEPPCWSMRLTTAQHPQRRSPKKG